MKNIVVHDMQRGSGKTKQITHRLLGDPKLLILVGNNVQKRHMMAAVNNHALRNLHIYLDSHIMTFDEFMAGVPKNYHDIDKILIDEGLNLEYEKMFNLIYHISQLNLKAEVYGSSHVYTDRIDLAVRQLRDS